MIRYPLLAVTLVALALAGTACAKRPTMAGASAPAPGGAGAATTPGGPATASKPSDASRPAASQPEGPKVAARQAPAPGEFVPVADLRDVYFDFDRYEIRPADTKVLDANGTWLQKNAGSAVVIEGHADERGTPEYNLTLGERRARAALNYLTARGVAATRMTVISYGESRPACKESNEPCWSKNRRAHFLVRRK